MARDGQALKKLEYAETVIAEAHKRTLANSLNWEVGPKSINLTLTDKIELSINYFDVGPDSAGWEYVYITHPVGKDATVVGNPEEPKAKYAEIQALGVTLDQINHIFSLVLLDPRHQTFEAALKKLRE